MPSSRLTSLLSAAALVAFAAPVLAQGPSPVDLGKRTAKSKYQVGRIFAVQELPDGRVVASDAKEGAFRLIDLVKGDDALIGKQGEGADQYRTATTVLPLPGDSLLLYDPAGRKALHLAPDGQVGAVVPMPRTGARTVIPTAADGSGAFYYAISEFDTVAKTIKPSASLRRFTPGATADQEVARINLRSADQAQARGLVVFPLRDAWAVRRDGLLARVRADSYQVIWIRDGHETGRTGALPYQPIPITPAEQQAISDSIHQGIKNMVGMAGPASRAIGDGAGASRTVVFGGDGGGGGGNVQVFVRGAGDGAPVAVTGGDKAALEAGKAAGQAAAANGQSVTFTPGDIPIAPFPATKPAIATSGVVAMFDPNGALWVARERVRGDNIPKYDVIVEGKGVVGQVKLPANTRIVGFGKSGVYLAHVDGDAEWLERYPVPTFK